MLFNELEDPSVSFAFVRQFRRKVLMGLLVLLRFCIRLRAK